MPSRIQIVYSSSSEAKSTSPKCLAVLNTDNWDDYSFKTNFSLTVFDETGKKIECGSLKIGFKGQQRGRTSESLLLPLENLSENYFSLGQDVQYYKSIRNELSAAFGKDLLLALRDVVLDSELLRAVQEEDVFQVSLTRGVRLSTIHGQFKRVWEGGAPLTEFKFSYRDPGTLQTAQIELTFNVAPESKPPTNVHVLIGRNGVGKTTLLNNMTRAILEKGTDKAGSGKFLVSGAFSYISDDEMPEDFFSAVVSVSFSAFDPFRPLEDRPNRNKGVAYFYVGMKNVVASNEETVSLKSHADLCCDFLHSLGSCFSMDAKKARWLAAIKRLESDDNFADMGLGSLVELKEDGGFREHARSLFKRMSSGHAIVLLTMTRLVDTVDEKTLVLMDEPESHLHPPLLSAFTRALSDLLTDRNGVAIIATHSPVVVQEVPRSCVWMMERSRAEGTTTRPQLETFGENVGVLTSEIFGLEVTRSGFHDMLRHDVEQGKTYEEIVRQYEGRLGFEAQALLRAMVASKPKSSGLEEAL
jgi:predicted ATPase